MRAAARLAAAMEILETWRGGTAPVERLLAQWGHAHRFAGAKDRAAIADRVYGALRRRASAVWLTGGIESGRALVLGTLVLEDRLSVQEISALLAEGGPHAPAPLSPSEISALDLRVLDDAPPWVQGNYPAWTHDMLCATLGAARAEVMAAMAARAPLDLRVNRLKATRDEARALLAAEGLAADDCPSAPNGLRLTPGAPVMRSRAYRNGFVEIQDEGSQIVSLLAGATPGQTVIDLAAGAGGKSLALAAHMDNRGRIIAADIDTKRLGELKPRAQRAGADIIESRPLSPWEEGPDQDFQDIGAGADVVLIDAPCSGSGTWRRAPETKWRLTPDRLTELGNIQMGLLRRGAGLVKPGGRLVYVTCSLFEAENQGAIRAFLQDRLDFATIIPKNLLAEAELGAISALKAASVLCPQGVALWPGKTGTDGFFIAALIRRRG